MPFQSVIIQSTISQTVPSNFYDTSSFKYSAMLWFLGVFIEGPAEAAMRELKEETGIKLKLSDISSSPFVDLAQTDNINPHKGTTCSHFPCVVSLLVWLLVACFSIKLKV